MMMIREPLPYHLCEKTIICLEAANTDLSFSVIPVLCSVSCNNNNNT